MPTYVLEGGSSATLPAKPLTLRVQGTGHHDIRIEARVDGGPDPTAITPMPGMLVLPRVPAPVEVRVLPAKGQTFPSGTVVALSAAIELHGDVDPERAVMQGVDLSGLAQRDLLRVEPVAGELRLTSLGVVVDAPLPALAGRARDLARELLGAERVPAGAACDLTIVVDGSASMRSLVADGSVGAALEVVVGASRVTSADRRVEALVGADQLSPVTADTVAELPRAVHEALAAMPARTGFRAGGAATHGAGTSLCVVSDGVPADLPVLREGQGLGLVVLAAPSARSVLATRAPAGTAWLPVGEWGSHSAYDLLMEDEAALREAVGAVLTSIVSEVVPTGRTR